MAIYVDNEKLLNDIVEWKSKLEKDPSTRMSDSIGIAIMNIANGFTNYWRFSRYTDDWKELMVGDAVETCVKYLKSFDATRYDNPHGYITMICARCFFGRIEKEKERDAAKYKYFLEHVHDEDDEDMAKLVDVDFYNDMMSKVNDFEKNRKKHIQKKKLKVGALDWMEDSDDLSEN